MQVPMNCRTMIKRRSWNLLRDVGWRTCCATNLEGAYVPNKLESCLISSDYPTPATKSCETYSVILPPPNITGTLHLGHALTVTIQDVLIRWNKMRGVETLWIPGIDHAGIATQVVVEKKLFKETGLTRYQIGRDKFLEEVWAWKNNKSKSIEDQLRKLDASLDWSQKIFTMDETHSKAVTEAFIMLYEMGLIYRANHLVNWCCTLQSAISDIEVEHLQIAGPTHVSVPNYEKPVLFGLLARVAYKFVDSDDEIVVVTTRPETILGDVAIAVNPSDSRYTSMIGKQVLHPFRNEPIPIICDDLVDATFGTGAVKITPAHHHTDFEISKRQNLSVLQVIDKNGCLTSSCGQFSGLPRFAARDTILHELANMKLLRGFQEHNMVVPLCSRSGDVVEYLTVPQWFVKCKEMAQAAADDVRCGNLKIEPCHFEKTWFAWLDGIRDWCVSRQLWWGHRVPAYLCYVKKDVNEKKWVVSRNIEDAREKAAILFSTSPSEVCVEQDEDVLDTWFSSALLPFSSFGWPQKTKEMDRYYPLSIMETGHDILFFWVSRMVMLGKKLTGQLPFNKVLLHGMMCDVYGRKMSKSLGNVVAPEDIISGITLQNMEGKLKTSLDAGILSHEEFQKARTGLTTMFPDGIPECGSDALRFTLCSHNSKNHFINFDVKECNANRLFCNKIWQATKFTTMWLAKVGETQELNRTLDEITQMDKWILSRLSFMVDTVNEGLSNNDFHVATAAIKNYLYFEFCDIYLEVVKRGIRLTDSGVAASHCWTLIHCLETSLLCLNPFMPRLAGYLLQCLPDHPVLTKTGDFPQGFQYRNVMLEMDMETVMNVVVAIRRLKKIFNVTAKYNPKACIVSQDPVYEYFLAAIEDLTRCKDLVISADIPEEFKDALRDEVGGSTNVYLLIPEELESNFEVDISKLKKKHEKVKKELEKLQLMVSTPSYKFNATSSVQDSHAKKIQSLQEKLSRLCYIERYSYAKCKTNKNI